MPISSASPAGPSLIAIELGLTLVTVAVAFCGVLRDSRLFGWLAAVERGFGRIARKRRLAVFLAGALPCTLRLLLLPLSPIPEPYIHDDFSFLLAADTFAHGRLTNPTPAMWTHFESFHITLKPTYMSMYFPGQAAVMAAGKLLAGHPWYGIWATCGLMCASLCWMLQGWLPPSWALLGAVLAALRLALFSYWMNTYTGAGALAALGGALVLGALPRIRRHFQARDFFWMALGTAILANSRPYEGLLVCIPCFAAVAWAVWKDQHPPGFVLVRRGAPAGALLAATFVFMGYYNYRVFGNPLTPPYKVNRETYSAAPYFVWQSIRPVPIYRHRIMSDFYVGSDPRSEWSELQFFRNETTSGATLVESAFGKLVGWAVFYLNVALIPPMVMLARVLLDRRIRFFAFASGFFIVGLLVEVFFLPHYFAPATALLYALLLHCMRHLRASSTAGLFLARALPAVCVLLAGIRVLAQPLNIDITPHRHSSIILAWYGTSPLGLDRARVLAQLEKMPGRQLAIVPYSPGHMLNDWVYNHADIDGSKVVWVRQMDPASDRKLLEYYDDRKAWLVEPDRDPPRISPYVVKEAGEIRRPGPITIRENSKK